MIRSSPVRVRLTRQFGQVRGHLGPVGQARTDVGGHRAACGLRIAARSAAMIARCSAASTPMRWIVVPGHFQVPGHVAERLEERLEPVQLLGQERIAARFANEIVQAVIELAGLGHRVRIGRRGGEFANLGGQGFRHAPESTRRVAPRIASHSRTLRTWHTSRTVRAVTFRTTAPRLGSKSTTPMPRSSISASRMGVWLTRKRIASESVTSRWPGAQVTVEDIGQDGANDRRPAQAVVERGFDGWTILHFRGGLR